LRRPEAVPPALVLASTNSRVLRMSMICSAEYSRSGPSADGYLYVVDRLKELIKYKGFQVPPAELEAVLLRHPDVADAAVIGLPDDEAGEVPVGYVVLRAGPAASTAEIMRFVAGEVAHYKQIRRLEVIDAIPKSAAGKILRRVLRDSART
jgi:acyl-coenzyme A synthetase/AMP-(fatty) acid ligase